MMRRITICMLLALSAALALGGCGPQQIPAPGESQELVVATRNSPTTYYTDQDGEPKGFEYDLVSKFAQQQGWRLRIVVEDNLEALLKAVRQGQVHLAAAGLTATNERKRFLAFGPSYGEVKEWVVCNARIRQPKNLDDLADLRLEVVAGSSHEDHLKTQARKHPGLKWVAIQAPGSEELLERVDLGLSDCTISDSDGLAVAHNFYSNLRDAFVLQDGQPQAWALRVGVDVAFSRKLETFFREMKKSGELGRLWERYYGHVDRLGDADVSGILERRVTTLRDLTGLFREAEKETGLDWRLLAAVAYQESQWDAHAISPTGVRGIMMLTVDTADRMGVKNRLDAEDSIMGGARYIVLLRDSLSESIPEPDRTWMALAAYNVGLGHLEDARKLAERLGRNPNDWRDMKATLPLLSRSQYNAGLKYGYARGGEARAFAENVRIYFDILSRYEKPHRDIWSLH